MLISEYHYLTVFERAYQANGFNLPIAKPMYDTNAKAKGLEREKKVCANISDVFAWAEDSENRARVDNILRKSREWVATEYNPNSISLYMLNVLKKYQSLQKFEPKTGKLRGPVSVRDVQKNTKRRVKCP